jgi:hypothetical protein
MVFFDVERTLSISDCLPHEDFCRSQFAREWVVPQGFIDVAFSNVEKSATGCSIFTVMRDITDGLADDEFRQRFGFIVPHVRRALLIGNVIDRHKVEAAALADTLDTLASTMFIVDDTGRIVHANASGYAMVAEGRVLHAPGGRLGANDPAADQALRDIFTAAGGGDAVLGKRGVAVPLEAARRRTLRRPCPAPHLRSAAQGWRLLRRGSGDVRSQGGARSAFPAGNHCPAVSADACGTAALFSIVEIGGVSEVADVLGISDATVRTHLHRLFEKTGTGRQADPVKLVADYCAAP